MAKARAMTRAGKDQQDAYYCSGCDAWHTTRNNNKRFTEAIPRYNPTSKGRPK